MWLVFGLLLLASAHQISYHGFQVLRVSANEPNYNLKDVLDLSERTFADVWHFNQAEGWVDVMVSPHQLPFFSNLSFVTRIQNVQEQIDESRITERPTANFLNNVSTGAFPFDFFPTNAQIRTWVRNLVEEHKGEAETFTLGHTFQGQEIQGLSIGDKAKPMFYMHCTIHAREWIATTSCLWIIDQLLNEPANRDVRAAFHWVIVPVHNVDGYDYTRSGDRLWRKNRQPNSGTTCVGTDVNRNYGFQWGGAGASSSPCSDTYRGSAKWSAPEGKAEDIWLAPHILRKTVKAYVDIHAYGGYVLSAWGYTTKLTPPNFPEMDKNMRTMVAAIRAVNGNSYTFGQSGATLYETSGSTVDDLYGAGGVVNAYTIECAGNNFTPPTSAIPTVGKEVWAGIRSLALALL